MNQELLFRYFNDSVTQEELCQIEEWLDSGQQARNEFEAAHALYNVLLLRNDELVLDSVVGKEKSKMTFSPVWSRIFRYAAAVAVVVLTGFGGMMLEKEVTYQRMSSQMNVIEVPDGKMMAMTLPDGSRIHLNGGSTLKYPMVFKRDQRRVSLEGEALFEVTHDKNHPFIVEGYATEVEVLGTKFNVHSDSDNGHFTTTLVDGKVKVSTMGEHRDQVILNPDEMVRFVNNRLVVTKVSAKDAICWTDGFISLCDADFKEVLCRLESMYGVDIVVERDTMPELGFLGGKIKVSEGLDFALRILQTGGTFTYEKDNNSNTIIIR